MDKQEKIIEAIIGLQWLNKVPNYKELMSAAIDSDIDTVISVLEELDDKCEIEKDLTEYSIKAYV